MGRERKTVEKEGKKHHLEATLWVRDDLGAREDELGRGCQKALLLSLCQICFCESGSSPAHCFLLCGSHCHFVAMGDALDVHAMARCLELRGENGCKEEEEEEEEAAVEEQRSGK
jgi:hypothetical protein